MSDVHLELKKLYAEDAKHSDTPWVYWEFRNCFGEWIELNQQPFWREETNYRRKPDAPVWNAEKTEESSDILIGDVVECKQSVVGSVGKVVYKGEICTVSSIMATKDLGVLVKLHTPGFQRILDHWWPLHAFEKCKPVEVTNIPGVTVSASAKVQPKDIHDVLKEIIQKHYDETGVKITSITSWLWHQGLDGKSQLMNVQIESEK